MQNSVQRKCSHITDKTEFIIRLWKILLHKIIIQTDLWFIACWDYEFDLIKNHLLFS